jgi:hypothetical protein
MEEAHFLEELKKYRVVRKPDHLKVKWNQRQSNATKKSTPGEEKTVKIDSSSVDEDAGFWEILEMATKELGLTTLETKRFFVGMRLEHTLALSGKLNLEDLEKLASGG